MKLDVDKIELENILNIDFLVVIISILFFVVLYIIVFKKLKFKIFEFDLAPVVLIMNLPVISYFYDGIGNSNFVGITLLNLGFMLLIFLIYVFCSVSSMRKKMQDANGK